MFVCSLFIEWLKQIKLYKVPDVAGHFLKVNALTYYGLVWLFFMVYQQPL